MGYVIAVVEGLLVVRYLMAKQNGSEKKFTGYPVEVTGDQWCRIVGKYLDNNPEHLNEPSHNLVVKALENAFYTDS